MDCDLIPSLVLLANVEGLFALADQREARLTAAQRHVDALTPSLPPSHRYGGTRLARAFSGKLVPQDPNEEPASALLERIQQNGRALERRRG